MKMNLTDKINEFRDNLGHNLRQYAVKGAFVTALVATVATSSGCYATAEQMRDSNRELAKSIGDDIGKRITESEKGVKDYIVKEIEKSEKRTGEYIGKKIEESEKGTKDYIVKEIEKSEKATKTYIDKNVGDVTKKAGDLETTVKTNSTDINNLKNRQYWSPQPQYWPLQPHSAMSIEEVYNASRYYVPKDFVNAMLQWSPWRVQNVLPNVQPHLFDGYYQNGEAQDGIALHIDMPTSRARVYLLNDAPISYISVWDVKNLMRDFLYQTPGRVSQVTIDTP